MRLVEAMEEGEEGGAVGDEEAEEGEVVLQAGVVVRDDPRRSCLFYHSFLIALLFAIPLFRFLFLANLVFR